MKLPKSFRPDKNLEKKTEQLLEEPSKADKLSEEFDRVMIDLDSLVEGLISDYNTMKCERKHIFYEKDIMYLEGITDKMLESFGYDKIVFLYLTGVDNVEHWAKEKDGKSYIFTKKFVRQATWSKKVKKYGFYCNFAITETPDRPDFLRKYNEYAPNAVWDIFSGKKRKMLKSCEKFVFDTEEAYKSVLVHYKDEITEKFLAKQESRRKD